MAGNLGAIFIDSQRIVEEQNMLEEEVDIGDDKEDHVEYMLLKEDTIAIAGLANRLPSRINHHPWLLQVRNTAIDSTVRAGGPFGVRKITVYAAMIYVDRFLSSMPIKRETFESTKLLAMACLHLACQQLEQDYHKPELSKYAEFAQCSGESILNMKSSVVAQFQSFFQFIQFSIAIQTEDFHQEITQRKKMEEDWGDFRDEEEDFGGEIEDYVESMLIKDDSIAIAELTSRLPSRITSHPWLLHVRNDAIYHILHTGRTIGVRKITIYSAVIYVDRFLSLMKIVKERFDPSMLLGVACLFMAAKEYEEHPNLDSYVYFGQCSGRSIMNMTDHILNHFGGFVSFVTPMDFINYFLSKFCTDLARKETARAIAVQVIMSTTGDERLMSLRSFVLGAAATLLASKPDILTEQMIQNEINALPENRPIPLDEMCSCYNRLLETNRDRLDIN